MRSVKELEIEVHGRVQGVGFRQLVKKYSDKNNITGFVFNKEEGSVFITGQGSEKVLQDLLTWLKSNPGFSKVNELHYAWKKVLDKHENFKIIHTKSFILEQARNFFNLGKYILSKKIKTPIHIAIIPDGNRRWAKSKGLQSQFGHYKAGSIGNVRGLLSCASDSGVKYFSMWGFSTENWKRDDRELKSLFKLLIEACKSLESDALTKKYRFLHIGRKDRLPKDLMNALKNLEEATKDNLGMTIGLCLDYGGRDEILHAVNNLLKSGKKKISEKEFGDYLYTSGMPDVDLIIRTSGEQRTSGFMPFQATYAELYFIEKHFPDFTPKDLKNALHWYANRERRFGGK